MQESISPAGSRTWILPHLDTGLIGTIVDCMSKKDEKDMKLVTVLSTGEGAMIALAKSILDEAGIPYLIKDELTQDLFGLGRLGASSSLIVGPVEIQVRYKDAERALELLEELKEGYVYYEEEKEEED